ncbi:unnamed protein product [marine sediment metagenome]|uniref:Uncharacterized protein n=1 Tax=marine sediment metagenome TaxID=412755 RepID=X0W4M3_9ZZZZ
MPTRRFQKGDRKPSNSGRKKGTPNKFTTLKQAFLNSFNSKEMGGEKGMTDVFSANSFTKREFYKLISKMLPSNVTVDGDLNVTFQASEKFTPKVENEKK